MPDELRAYQPTLLDRIRWGGDALARGAGGWLPPDFGQRTAAAFEWTPLGAAYSGGRHLASPGLANKALGLGEMALSLLPFGALLRSPAALKNARLSAQIYDPPSKPQRSFYDDYPRMAGGRVGEPLTETIEGAPLRAKYVAGRRRVGEGDVGLLPAEELEVAEALAKSVGPGTREELGRGVAGRYTRDGRIIYDEALPPQQIPLVVGHEFGHAVIDKTKIPVRGLQREARKVYHDLATGQPYRRPLLGPEDFGYPPGGVSDHELMAEVLRAYRTDPNYLKTTAPKNAERARKWVNEHPTLSKILQLNALPLGFALPQPTGAPGRE